MLQRMKLCLKLEFPQLITKSIRLKKIFKRCFNTKGKFKPELGMFLKCDFVQ